MIDFRRPSVRTRTQSCLRARARGSLVNWASVRDRGDVAVKVQPERDAAVNRQVVVHDNDLIGWQPHLFHDGRITGAVEILLILLRPIVGRHSGTVKAGLGGVTNVPYEVARGANGLEVDGEIVQLTGTLVTP